MMFITHTLNFVAGCNSYVEPLEFKRFSCLRGFLNIAKKLPSLWKIVVLLVVKWG